jgi:hypothetical protein
VSEVRECAQSALDKVTTNVVPMVRKSDSYDVPEGFYGLVSRKDGETVRFRVDKPSEGRWRGYTFVKQLDDAGETPVRDASRRQMILRAIASDIRAAYARYGKETGICGCCGRKLTTKVSIKKGIGPVCEKRFSA